MALLPEQFIGRIAIGQRASQPGLGFCWVWTGSKRSSKGYGSYSMGGRAMLAHRAVLVLLGYDLPDDKEVDHLCNEPSCVNPRHLEVVSRAVNRARSRLGEEAKADADRQWFYRTFCEELTVDADSAAI